MLSDVNLHYLTLAARCPVSGCWPSCSPLKMHNRPGNRDGGAQRRLSTMPYFFCFWFRAVD